MGNWSASDVLPPGSEQEIRRLRFADADLERAFLQEYAEKSRRYLRIVTGLVLFIPTVGLVGSLVQERAQLGTPLFWITEILPVLITLGALLLTWSPQFPRFFQGCMALLCLVMPITIIRKMLPNPGDASPLLVAALYTYTLFRLRFLTATLVYWTLIIFFLGFCLLVLRAPTSTASLPGIVIANFMGMLAGYTLEHAARRDFLLSRLLEQEREKSERLLLDILPAPVAERLKERTGTVADSFAEVTVLFADIVDFTPLAARLSADEVVKLLNEVFTSFDGLADRHGLEKIKTIGDAYMVVGGLPEPRGDHAEAVMAMALDMQRQITRFQRETGEPLRLRIGINTGPVVAGVIGARKLLYDLWGDTVNMASRMESHDLAGTIQVTEATFEQLRHLYQFEERRVMNVKGRGEMTTYLLLDGQQTGMAKGDPVPG